MSISTQIRNFRKACVDKAIDDGYFDDANCARKYDLDDDGTWRLKSNHFAWFKTGIHIDNF